MEQAPFALTPKQRSELIARHRREHSSRHADRIKTILWRDEGVSHSEIAHRLFRDEDMVRHYERVFRERGLDALLSDNFKAYDGKLEQHQEEQLYDYVATHLFLDVAPIQAYVYERFHVSYSASGMRELLHRIGFTYKKTSHAPGKADEAKQRAFIAIECESVNAQAAVELLEKIEAHYPGAPVIHVFCDNAGYRVPLKTIDFQFWRREALAACFMQLLVV